MAAGGDLLSGGSLRITAPLTGVGGLFERIAQFILPKGAMEPDNALRVKMIQAGYYNTRVIRIYYLMRILLAVGMALGLAIVMPIIAADTAIQSVIILAGAAGMMGYFLPVFLLSRRVRKRQLSIREGFPDALDMLLVCVESGLGLDGALARVADEIGRAHPLLSEQFGFIGRELRVGRDREVALRSMAERIGIDEVTSLVTLLIQTDKLGTSIGDALRAHAYEMRSTRLLRAEEKAMKLPVKLSVPLIFFILPALLLVILAPASISIGRDMFPALQNVDLSIF
ncbi:MAG: type II secretion system F family protein [Alphaproteobacteria bacterium]|nr:type II secretion system F family protein [Alphaproteobacteria bacterium]